MPASTSSLRQRIKPYVPLTLYDHGRRVIGLRQTRRARHETLRSCVSSTIDAIRSLTPQQCSDPLFLEHEFIPSLGLNDEALQEQPTELSRHFGTGLHLWQYPNQLADYLAWLSGNATDVKCYMEIGCRFGGMFILITEWLRKNGADVKNVVAIDPIEPSPFIDEYFEYLRNEKGPDHPKVEALYIRDFSTSVEVKRLMEFFRPDFVFIDGDHSLKGALADHMLARESARYIVHHDVNSDSCTETTMLWNILKKLERNDFEFVEFVDQYDSVDGKFLGIGLMKRTTP